MTSRLSAFAQQHRRLTYAAIAIFLVISIALVPFAFSFARQAGAAETGLFGLPVLGEAPVNAQGEPIDAADLKESQGIPLPEPWDGAERVTVLVMGLDYRDVQGGEGPARSDTMILLTIDPVAKTAIWLVVITAIFAPLAIHRYRRRI